MTSGPAPMCVFCKRRRVGLECDAFPEGIPDAIIFGKDHREPYPGDNGLMYVQMDMKELLERYQPETIEYFLKKWGIKNNK